MTRTRILLVEDDPDIAEAMVEILHDGGYDVVPARNGSEALSKLESGPLPDLIFLDLMMPQMDGAEFRHEQLKSDRIKDIPVVLCSAVHNLAARAQALGVAAWLLKPTTPDKVLEAVQQFAATV